MELLKGKPVEDFKVPDNVTAMEIDAFGGGLPVDGQPKRTEYFLKGTQPQISASIYQRLKISKQTGKVANDVEVAKGDYEEKDYIVLSEDDPVSTDGKNRWQEGIDEYVLEHYKDDSRFFAPRDTSSAQSDTVVVKINKPSDKQRINDNDVDFDITAVSSKQIVKISLFIDDKEKKVWEQANVHEKVNINDGAHLIKIVARDNDGHEGESQIKIGVNADALP